MNIRKSKLILALILLFTVFCATFTQNTHAEYKTYIEYGRSIVNSHNGHGGVGFVSEKTGWGAGVTIVGQGGTQNGRQVPAYIYSVSKIHRTFIKGVNLRLGIAKADNVNLVGDFNYKLGIIFLSNEHGEFELIHISSGGIYKPNTGYDALVFRLKF